MCFKGIQWKKVKSLPYTSSKWYSTKDNLQGTESVGTGLDDTVEWSLPFSTDDFDRFLFASGDFTIWLQALKSEVNPGVQYGLTSKNVINSSINDQNHMSEWKNTDLEKGPEVYLDKESSALEDYN